MPYEIPRTVEPRTEQLERAAEVTKNMHPLDKGVFEAFQRRVNPSLREQEKTEARANPDRLVDARKAAAAAMFGLEDKKPESEVAPAVKPTQTAEEMRVALDFAAAAQIPPDDGEALYYENGVAVYGDEDDGQEDW